MAGPLGMGGAATACFQSLGGGAAWKSLSVSLRIFRGRKWPSLALRRFSYFLNSTKVLTTSEVQLCAMRPRHHYDPHQVQNAQNEPQTSPGGRLLRQLRPIKDPFHHISSWYVWNFIPYCNTTKMDAKVKVLDLARRLLQRS